MPKRGQLDPDAKTASKKKRPYNSKTKKDRASRNAARAKLEKEGRVKKGDGKDVDHKNRNPRDNSDGNLKVTTKKQRGDNKPAKKARPKTARRPAGVRRKAARKAARKSEPVSTFEELREKGRKRLRDT